MHFGKCKTPKQLLCGLVFFLHLQMISGEGNCSQYWHALYHGVEEGLSLKRASGHK